MGYYSQYGLDDQKKSRDDGTKGLMFCPWCNDSHVHARSFNLCFSNFVICDSCVESADRAWNKERWQITELQCFKCRKPSTEPLYRCSPQIPEGNEIYICKDCLQWAHEVMNKPPEPPAPGTQLSLL